MPGALAEWATTLLNQASQLARSTPGPPPPGTATHFDVAVRQGMLARRGITLPQIYLEAARKNDTLFP